MAMDRPTRYKGSAAVLEMKLHDATDWINLSGHARGLDGFDFSRVEDDREIPGGGTQISRQLLGYTEATASFTTDENSITAPLFFGKNGRRFDVRWSPRGRASGGPVFTFEAINTISHTYEARGVRRFSIECEVDGLITKGTIT